MQRRNPSKQESEAGRERTHEESVAISNAPKESKEERTEKKLKQAKNNISPSDSIKEKLLNDFSDVLSDELSPTPMKTEKPMHITLKKNHSPFKTLSARRVALRYE